MKPSSRLLLSLGMTAALLVAFFIVSSDNATAQTDETDLPARSGLEAMFERAGCAYPPTELAMIALKAERRIEVWAPGPEGKPALVADYPIYGASGTAGPKLAQGDRQVPEGVYSVERLNPYSRFHLSMKLDYPNKFDTEMAEADGRTCLGGDIFIHGNSVSTGCLAVGDMAVEELFTLVEDMDGAPVKVIIAPYDFRKQRPVVRTASTVPAWLPELYEIIALEMSSYWKDAGNRQARAR